MKKTFLLRQVYGQSMTPTLKQGKLVIAKSKFDLATGNIIIATVNGREIIKRVDKINKSSVYLLGDNSTHSTDSRSLGWINREQIIGKVIWPQLAN